MVSPGPVYSVSRAGWARWWITDTLSNWSSLMFHLSMFDVCCISTHCTRAHYTATRQSGNNLYLPHSSTQDQPRLGKTEKHHLFCKKREEGGGLELTNRQLTSELSLTRADRRLKWEERLKNGMFSDLNCCGIMVCSGRSGPWTLSWVGAIRAETSEQTLTDHRVMMIHPDNCQSQAAPASASPEHKHNNKAGRGETRLSCSQMLCMGYLYRMWAAMLDIWLTGGWCWDGELRLVTGARADTDSCKLVFIILSPASSQTSPPRATSQRTGKTGF